MSSIPTNGLQVSTRAEMDEKSIDGKRRRRRKVAIVGTGLAGLYAAHLLSESATLREQYDVHLFERSDKMGLDGNSISVEGRRIDVPLRSFNAGYYPNLMRLYQKLNIPIRRNNFTFSFATISQDHAPSPSPFLLYNGHSGLRGVSIPLRATQQEGVIRSIRRSIDYARLLLPIAASYLYLLFISLFHYTLGHLHDPSNRLAREPLQVWLAHHPYHYYFLSNTFVEAVLIPLFSAMTTSSLGEVGRIPTAEILLYIATTFLRNHYTVQGGVKQVQRNLHSTIPNRNVHLRTSVQKVVFVAGGKEEEGRCLLSTFNVETQARTEYGPFDHVIFATPASHSASALDNCTSDLDNSSSSPSSFSTSRSAIDSKVQRIQAQLSQIRYESSTVINHTDQSLMPPSRKNWRDLNLVTSPTTSLDEQQEQIVNAPNTVTQKNKKKRQNTHTMATHACHQLQDGRFVFQTTNSLMPPEPTSILSTSTFPRALTVSKEQIKGLYSWEKRDRGLLGTGILPTWSLTLGDLQRTTDTSATKTKLTDSNLGLWFCGSYCQGIPLLEGCVTSSALVVAEILQQDRHNL